MRRRLCYTNYELLQGGGKKVILQIEQLHCRSYCIQEFCLLHTHYPCSPTKKQFHYFKITLKTSGLYYTSSLLFMSIVQHPKQNNTTILPIKNNSGPLYNALQYLEGVFCFFFWFVWQSQNLSSHPCMEQLLNETAPQEDV